MKTLYEHVTGWMEDQARKHELGEDYTERTVNAMSNWELLNAISVALEEMKYERSR